MVQLKSVSSESTADKARKTRRRRSRAPDDSTTIAEIDNRIAIARENLRELVEQAAAYSGASDEELMSERITEEERKLVLLTKRREELSQAIST